MFLILGGVLAVGLLVVIAVFIARDQRAQNQEYEVAKGIDEKHK